MMVAGFFYAHFGAEMRVRIKKSNRCRGCVWNNRRVCGRDFCVLPRCIYTAENISKRGGDFWGKQNQLDKDKE